MPHFGGTVPVPSGKRKRHRRRLTATATASDQLCSVPDSRTDTTYHCSLSLRRSSSFSSYHTPQDNPFSINYTHTGILREPTPRRSPHPAMPSVSTLSADDKAKIKRAVPTSGGGENKM